MRKMYTEEQVAEIVKANSTKLYYHYYDNDDNGSYISFISPYSSPLDIETLVDAFYDSKIFNLVLRDTLDNIGLALGIAIDEDDTNFIYGNCANADETLKISVTKQDLINLHVTKL